MAKKPNPLIKDYIVQNTSETRADLTKILEGWRRDKKARRKSLPILFGSHGKPEAVLVAAPLWEKILDELDDLRLALVVQERLHSPQAPREVTIEQLHEESEAMIARLAKSKDAANPTDS